MAKSFLRALLKSLLSHIAFIAVEIEAERLVKQFGFKDNKPDEKFIKTVQKSAAANGMTVAEYRDKILFLHGKERIIKRFKMFYKLKR